MGSLALAAEESVAAAPDEVFALFGAGGGAGWVFDATCDQVAVGAVLTLDLPIGGPDRPETITVLGRITSVAAGRHIVITHDQPWHGRLRILFDEVAPGSTKVRLIASVDEAGVEWLLRQRGWPTSEQRTDGTHRIGLLTSKSGPGAIFAVACENLAHLAVEEINADGGLCGRKVRLVVGDDATDPGVGAAEAARLVRAGCRVVLASVTSATFGAVQQAVGASGVPLVHTVINEGGAGPGHVFRLGERPGNQMAAAAGSLMRESGARNWFFVGDDYCWSRGAHRAARGVLDRDGGVVVGERYVPLGTKDFSRVIEDVLASGAELVLSTLVGADEVAFERQSLALGLRSRCRTLALVLDESTRERIGDTAATGLWTVFGYFQQLRTDGNDALLASYHDSFGRWAPPVSSLSESVYEAAHLYAAAARRAGGEDPARTAEEFRWLRAELPRGEVALAGPHTFDQTLYLAEAEPGGFRLLDATRRGW
jgi:urea transport system substrate-binding protein